MNWQDKYLCPLIEREKFSIKRVKKIVKDFFILFRHAVSFHENPTEPNEELPDFTSQDTDLIYSICKNFYDAANNRIDKLEEKAIKLLSYISATFAFISFAFVNTSIIFTKLVLIISMGSLILSILISFRCVNVKGRKAIFLPDIYDFSEESPKDTFDKKRIAKSLINAAIYNQNIADNVADILKVSRYMLAIALVISITGFTTGMAGYFNTSDTINTVKVDNQVDLGEFEEKLENTNEILNDMNNNIDRISDNKELNDQIDKLSKEIEVLKFNYSEILEKIDTLEWKNRDIYNFLY